MYVRFGTLRSSSLTQYWKNRLQTTQNKLVRFVLDLDSRSHIGPDHFKSLSWLPVARRVEQITLCHVHKIKYGTAPDYLAEHFVPINSIHDRCTRSRVSARSKVNADFTFNDTGRFYQPKVGSFGKKSFAYNGIHLWNTLPQELRNVQSQNVFKQSVKTHLLTC